MDRKGRSRLTGHGGHIEVPSDCGAVRELEALHLPAAAQDELLEAGVVAEAATFAHEVVHNGLAEPVTGSTSMRWLS